MTTKKIMASAQGQNCTVRIPQVCTGDTDTVVFAHVNGIRFGKGMGIKSNQGAYCCHACHLAIDEGQRPSWLSVYEVQLMHLQGVIETNDRLIEQGLMVLK